MLLRIYRNLVYIHDKYIYAANLYGSVYRELPSLIMPRLKTRSRKPLNIDVFQAITRKPLQLPPGFYDKLDKFTEAELSEDRLTRIIEEVKPRGVYDYILRGLDRELFTYLLSRGYIWVIPYESIHSLDIRKQDDLEIIAIRYMCPFTRTIRIFKTVYDPKIYNLIRELCRRTGNRMC